MSDLSEARKAAERAFVANLEAQAEDGEFLRIRTPDNPVVQLQLDGHFNFDAALDAFLSSLLTSHAVVPRECTIGMFRALVSRWREDESDAAMDWKKRLLFWLHSTWQEDYAAMLAAGEAPAPPLSG